VLYKISHQMISLSTLRLRYLLLLFFFALLNFTTSAQFVDMGTPISWKGKMGILKKQSEVLLPAIDIASLMAEDSINQLDKSSPWRFGFNHSVALTTNNSGEWFELNNGDRVWRLNLLCPDAKTINVIFDDFYIPDGAYMHMYNKDRTHIVGAYTHILNNKDRILGTELVEGQNITIEYFEPKSLQGQGSLSIGTITHGYRSPAVLGKDFLKGLNDSGACNIDVLCPLGNGWEDQIKSVALIIVGGNGICTGALINNTIQDGKPYFLTANHCLGNPANWVFRFNWHSTNPSCATTAPSGNGPFNQTTFNGIRRASNAQSDFALIELNQPLPSDWNVYYAGWDRRDFDPSFTVGIHHPNGDIKKICRDDDPAFKTTYSGAQVWRIEQWEHGVTEGGSSGSPLFDPSKRIIGQLLGGEAACISSNSTQNNGRFDVYGRLAVSWDGNNASSRLRDWLDPLNSGVLLLDGYDPLASSFDYDLALLSLGAEGNSTCDSEMVLMPQIRNSGTQAIQSFNIQVLLPLSTLLDYQWTGNLASGEIITVPLPPIPLLSDVNDITMIISDPNGMPDEDPSNNSSFIQIYTVPNGGKVIFNLTTDCWGSEITWNIKNEFGSIVWQGGSYGDVPGGETFQYEICLEEGCYTFEILDNYGDGLYGSQYNQCSVNGTYNMTDEMGNILFEMTAPNGDFGDSATHPFCVEASQSLIADFDFFLTAQCESASVAFNDLSEGEISQWIWSFPGGTPSSSSEQNPTILFQNPGTYSVTLQVIDHSGNSAEVSKPIMVAERDIPFLSIVQLQDFGCGDECNGLLEVAISGGQAPYEIMWSNGAQSALIDNVCFQPEYSVTITDAFGCISEASQEFEQEDIPEFEVVTSVDCESGEICAQLVSDLDLTGYDIQWSNGDNNVTSSCNLSSGANTVTVSNDSGCSRTKIFSKPRYEAFTIQSETIENACFGVCDASIALTIIPEDYQVTYEWSSSPSTSSTLVEACAGMHTVTVTDSNGCTKVESFSVEEAAPIVFEIESDILNCNLLSGCAELTVSGGSGTYEVNWSSGSSAEFEVCNLAEGLHTFTITDSNGCEVNDDFEMIREGDPLLSATTAGESCQGDCRGSVLIKALGSEPFAYQWSNGSNDTPQQEDLCSGIYTITVSDINGCESTLEVLISDGSELPAIQFTASSVTLNINIDPTVTFTNETNGATSYLWSFGDGNFSEVVSPEHTYLQTGVYEVVLTAFNETCAIQDSITITVSEFTSTQSLDLASSISISPNPAHSYFILKVEQGKELNTSVQIEMLDVKGRQILKQMVFDSSENQMEVNIGSLTPGLYLVRLTSERDTVVKKLIIH